MVQYHGRALQHNLLTLAKELTMYALQNTEMKMDAVELTADQACLCCTAINELDRYEEIYAIPSNLKHFYAHYVYRMLQKALQLPGLYPDSVYAVEMTMNAIMLADKRTTATSKS